MRFDNPDTRRETWVCTLLWSCLSLGFVSTPARGQLLKVNLKPFDEESTLFQSSGQRCVSSKQASSGRAYAHFGSWETVSKTIGARAIALAVQYITHHRVDLHITTPCPVQAMTAGRAVKPPSLIDNAIALVKGFDPKKQTGDSYADEATQTADSHADEVFLKQVQYSSTN